MPQHRRKTRGKKGGGWFGPDAPPDPNAPPTKTLAQRLSEITPSFLKSAPAPAPPSDPAPLPELPEPLKAAVEEGHKMAQTAGRRIKKHTGYDPASGKSMRRLFGTAKGDKMLGGRRRRRTQRR
jgi:hypothetical protein